MGTVCPLCHYLIAGTWGMTIVMTRSLVVLYAPEASLGTAPATLGMLELAVTTVGDFTYTTLLALTAATWPPAPPVLATVLMAACCAVSRTAWRSRQVSAGDASQHSSRSTPGTAAVSSYESVRVRVYACQGRARSVRVRRIACRLRPLCERALFLQFRQTCPKVPKCCVRTTPSSAGDGDSLTRPTEDLSRLPMKPLKLAIAWEQVGQGQLRKGRPVKDDHHTLAAALSQAKPKAGTIKLRRVDALPFASQEIQLNDYVDVDGTAWQATEVIEPAVVLSKTEIHMLKSAAWAVGFGAFFLGIVTILIVQGISRQGDELAFPPPRRRRHDRASR